MIHLSPLSCLSPTGYRDSTPIPCPWPALWLLEFCTIFISQGTSPRKFKLSLSQAFSSHNPHGKSSLFQAKSRIQWKEQLLNFQVSPPKVSGCCPVPWDTIIITPHPCKVKFARIAPYPLYIVVGALKTHNILCFAGDSTQVVILHTDLKNIILANVHISIKYNDVKNSTKLQ